MEEGGRGGGGREGGGRGKGKGSRGKTEEESKAVYYKNFKNFVGSGKKTKNAA